MKILIIGGSGELGHILCKSFSKNHKVFSLMRENSKLRNINFFDNVISENRCTFLESFENFEFVKSEIKKINPDFAINCVGVVKHKKICIEGNIETEYINSTFPHLLAETCIDNNIRLIHFSTDCVFSGKRGDYSESDTPDPIDYYGKSKLLGEVNLPNILTIRSSFIGPSLLNNTGLFEWVKKQKNQTIYGYKNAIYSGFTTIAFSKILIKIVENHPDLEGLFHISSEPISKFDLIHSLNEKFKLNIEIRPDNTFLCDRSLNSTAFRDKTNIFIPSWKEMIDELYIYNT